MEEEEQVKKKVGRKKWLLYGLLGGAVAVIAGIGTVLYQLSPVNYFVQGSIPVASTPLQTQTTSDHTSNAMTKLATVKKVAPVFAKGMARGTFNAVIMGLDNYTPGAPGRSDTIILIHVNVITHQYSVLSIPRDTRVYLPGWGMTKITHAVYLGTLYGNVNIGAHDALQAISNLTGLPVNYFAEVNFWGLEDIVDRLHGIDVYVPFVDRINHGLKLDYDGPPISPGYHFIFGKEALALAAERDTLPNGDFGRQQIQEQELIGIMKRLLAPSELIHLPAIIKAESKYLVTTNVSVKDALSMMLALGHFHTDQVHYYQVPGHPLIAMDPVLRMQLWYWQPNLKALHQIISDHFEN